MTFAVFGNSQSLEKLVFMFTLRVQPFDGDRQITRLDFLDMHTRNLVDSHPKMTQQEAGTYP